MRVAKEKMKEDLQNLEKQHTDLEQIVKELRTAFKGKTKYSFKHWNHADFLIMDNGEFIEYADIQKIDKVLKKHGRNIVLISPLENAGPLNEPALEIVTLESKRSPRKN